MIISQIHYKESKMNKVQILCRSSRDQETPTPFETVTFYVLCKRNTCLLSSYNNFVSLYFMVSLALKPNIIQKRTSHIKISVNAHTKARSQDHLGSGSWRSPQTDCNIQSPTSGNIIKTYGLALEHIYKIGPSSLLTPVQG